MKLSIARDVKRSIKFARDLKSCIGMLVDEYLEYEKERLHADDRIYTLNYLLSCAEQYRKDRTSELPMSSMSLMQRTKGVPHAMGIDRHWWYDRLGLDAKVYDKTWVTPYIARKVTYRECRNAYRSDAFREMWTSGQQSDPKYTPSSQRTWSKALLDASRGLHDVD